MTTPRPGRATATAPAPGGQALADWLATDPTGSGDADVLIIGDLNSYAKEDPIVALQDAGYTDLVAVVRRPGCLQLRLRRSARLPRPRPRQPEPAAQVAGVGRLAHQRRRDPALRLQRRRADAGEAAFEEESDCAAALRAERVPHLRSRPGPHRAGPAPLRLHRLLPAGRQSAGVNRSTPARRYP